jgi:CDP-diacylglycerol pyrophosphatase
MRRLKDAASALWGLVLALGLFASTCVPSFASADSEPFAGMPDALWRVISLVCVPAGAIGLPLPCSEVRREGSGGYAILAVSANHILTVPTSRITGIESPALLDTRGPNYWQAAWHAQTYLQAAAKELLARDDIGIAVNSEGSRSQDQFHLHTGCLRRDVRTAVAALKLAPGEGWHRVGVRLPGGRYRVRAVDGADLAQVNVLGLLDAADRADPSRMARQSVAVVGATVMGRPGFFVLNADSQDHAGAHAEALLDFSCASATRR